MHLECLNEGEPVRASKSYAAGYGIPTNPNTHFAATPRLLLHNRLDSGADSWYGVGFGGHLWIETRHNQRIKCAGNAPGFLYKLSLPH